MFGKEQLEFLEKKNYLNGLSLDGRIGQMADVIRGYESDYYEGLGDRIESYIKKQWLSPSTPQWSNLGKVSKGTTPLPISCYIVTPENSIKGIYYSYGEIAVMSKLGGGVGVDFTNVVDGGTYLEEDNFYTNSKLDWIEDSVRAGQKVSQGSTRRGYSVPMISIDDKEFNLVLDRASKKNPDKSDPLVSNNIGIILPIGWKKRIDDGDKELKTRYLRVLKERMSEGKLYMLDIENCNKNQSPVYSILNQEVRASNICQEITTPIYEDKSFVCVISSVNLVHWEEIKKDKQFLKDCYAFLDINVSEFIRLTEGVQFMEKARRSAIEKRDIGLGALGFHEYLQGKNMSFGGIESRFENKEIFKTIQDAGLEYSKEIAEKLGSPKMCQEAGLVRRNVSLNMVAPNKSTAHICGGTSEGIAPFRSNYFVKELAGIQCTVKNKGVTKLLKEKGQDTLEVWDSILKNLGSIQHLDFLTKEEKAPYKCFDEVSPKDMIDLVSDRQSYIDMGQSFNFCGRPNYTLKDVYDIHKYAWEKDIKTVYYFFSQGHAAIEKNGESWDSCESCAD